MPEPGRGIGMFESLAVCRWSADAPVDRSANYAWQAAAQRVAEITRVGPFFCGFSFV